MSLNVAIITAAGSGLGSCAKLFADRYPKSDIRMNNAMPGYFDSLPEEEAAKQRVPLGRYGEVEELVNTETFLLSDGAGYFTARTSGSTAAPHAVCDAAADARYFVTVA